MLKVKDERKVFGAAVFKLETVLAGFCWTIQLHDSLGAQEVHLGQYLTLPRYPERQEGHRDSPSGCVSLFSVPVKRHLDQGTCKRQSFVGLMVPDGQESIRAASNRHSGRKRSREITSSNIITNQRDQTEIRQDSKNSKPSAALCLQGYMSCPNSATNWLVTKCSNA